MGARWALTVFEANLCSAPISLTLCPKMSRRNNWCARCDSAPDPDWMRLSPLDGHECPPYKCSVRSFAKIRVGIAHPILWVHSRSHVSVKRAPRPIGDAAYIPVFRRVGMQVIHTSRKISIIAHRVLMKAALPQRAFAMCAL